MSRLFGERCRLAAVLTVSIAGIFPSLGHTAGRKPGLCATAAAEQSAPPYVVIFSAFPAELAPLVAATQVERAVEVGGRQYYVGRLDGVSVILGLTGIGLVNAETSATNLLGSFEAAGLIMSGVAGSPNRIGDVVLVARWEEPDRKPVFRANVALLALARRATTPLPTPLEHCTLVPPGSPEAHEVCMPFEPAVVFAAHGISSDPFGGMPLKCFPGGGDIFGCELPAATTSAASVLPVDSTPPPPDVEDMESAAVARVAAAMKVPFLAVRAVSDGAGDPLGDRGFPAQFADYYRLAAVNEATVTRAIVAELGQIATDKSSRRICRLLAKRQWQGAAKRLAH